MTQTRETGPKLLPKSIGQAFARSVTTRNLQNDSPMESTAAQHCMVTQAMAKLGICRHVQKHHHAWRNGYATELVFMFATHLVGIMLINFQHNNFNTNGHTINEPALWSLS